MSNITGGCHCGAIRYQVEGELIVHALCHCADCRRHAGAPMVGWTMYAEDAVKVTRGQPKVYEFLGAWTAAFLRQLWHWPVLHQRQHAARDHRHSERDLRRPRCRSGHGAYPGRRTAPLDGKRARTAHLRPLPAANLAATPRVSNQWAGYASIVRAAGCPGYLRESSRIIDAPFSAIIAVGVLVLPEVMVGITEASTTRSPTMP